MVFLVRSWSKLELAFLYYKLAVSTRPLAGTNYRASRSNSLGPCGPL